MVRLFLVLLTFLCISPSYAGGIAVVDFQRAVNETEEGKAAQGRLDAM